MSPESAFQCSNDVSLLKLSSFSPLVNSTMFLRNGMDAIFFLGSLQKLGFQSFTNGLFIPVAWFKRTSVSDLDAIKQCEYPTNRLQIVRKKSKLCVKMSCLKQDCSEMSLKYSMIAYLFL